MNKRSHVSGLITVFLLMLPGNPSFAQTLDKNTESKITADDIFSPKHPDQIFSAKQLEEAEKRSDLRDINGTLSDAFRLNWASQIPGFMNTIRSRFPETAERHYFEAVIHYNGGNKLQSLQSLEESLKFNQNFDRAWNLRGIIFLEGDRLQEAESSLRKAVAVSRYNPFYVHNLANALYRNSNVTEAMIYADLAISYKPNFAEAYYLRGLINRSRKNNQAALSDFEEARFYGLDSDDFIREFMNAAAAENKDALLIELSELLMKKGDSDAFRINALMRMKYGEYEKARQSMEKLILRPESNTEDRKNYIYIMFKLRRNPALFVQRLNISEEEKKSLMDDYNRYLTSPNPPELLDPIVNPVPRR